ncbi:MAG: zinc ribbon domain-containing protein [candidate division Zixibacteria bacterium]|nr:zinc ribbon domain-containing protein [candidate division Zixibacteria bacterium]
MPLYEYRCTNCDKKFEELVTGGSAEIVCPACGSKETQKLLSVFSAATGSSQTVPACARPGCGSGFG